MRINKNIQLIIATISLMFLGIAYAWSLFVDAIKAEYSLWTTTDFSMVFTIQMVGFCAASFVAGTVARFLGRKLLMLLCGILYGVGMVGASLATTPVMIWIFYGAICGMATGFVYNCVISMLVETFGNRAGTASGIMMMGYGMGGLLLGFIVTNLHQTIGWRMTFRVFAVLYIVVILICIITLEQSTTKKKDSTYEGIYGNTTLKQNLKKSVLWNYYFWGINIAMIGLGTIAHIAQTATAIETHPYFAIVITGVLSVSNGLSRILFGIIYDTQGRKVTMRLINICMAVGVVCICLSLFNGSGVFMIIGTLGIGCGYGGSVPCNSSYAKECFGSKHFADNFGFMASDGLLSAFIGPTLMSVIVTSTGRYINSYYVLFISCILLWIMEWRITKNLKKVK